MTDPNCSTLKDMVMLRPTSSCADAGLLGYFSIIINRTISHTASRSCFCLVTIFWVVLTTDTIYTQQGTMATTLMDLHWY